MMNCPTCSTNVTPVFVMGTDRRVTPHCPVDTCGARLTEDRVERGAPELKSMASQFEKLSEAATESVDVLATAQSRLAVVEAQIASMKKLENEAAMLRRMISAATCS